MVVSCPNCSFTTQDLTRLHEHRIKSHPKAPTTTLTCKNCNRSFDTVTTAKFHFKHCSAQLRKNQVQPTQVIQFDQQQPQQHQVVVLSSGLPTEHPQQLQNHQGSTGPLELQQQQQYIHQQEPQHVHQMPHQQQQQQQQQQPMATHKCKVCEAEFLSREDLVNHNMTKHVIKLQRPSGEEPVKRSDDKHTCPRCHIELCSRSGLNRHLRRMHTDVKCNLCGKAFENRRELKPHMNLVHTESRPFACNLCIDRFKNKDTLRKHMNLKHPGHSL